MRNFVSANTQATVATGGEVEIDSIKSEGDFHNFLQKKAPRLPGTTPASCSAIGIYCSVAHSIGHSCISSGPPRMFGSSLKRIQRININHALSGDILRPMATRAERLKFYIGGVQFSLTSRRGDSKRIAPTPRLLSNTAQ